MKPTRLNFARNRCAAILGMAALAGLAIPADAEQTFRVIAVSGMPTPGLNNATFSLFRLPTINQLGSTSWFSFIDGDNVTQDNHETNWLYDASGLHLIAREGFEAPGGGNYGNMSLDSPLLNNKNEVAFPTYLPTGVFAGPVGNIRALARGNAPIGGIANVNFGDFPILDGFDDKGGVLFHTDLKGAGTAAINNSGVFGGSVTPLLIARENSQIIGSNLLYGDLTLAGPRLAPSGKGLVTFPTRQVGSGNTDFARALMSLPANPSTPETIHFSGDVAIPNRVFGASLAGVSISDNGSRILYNSNLVDSVVNPTVSQDSLWTGTPGSSSLLLKQGDAAPGIANRFIGAHGGFGFLVSQVANNGDIAFGATLADAGGNEAGTAYWLKRNNQAAVPLLVQGQAAPDVPGATTSFLFSANVNLNNNGRVAIAGFLDGPGFENDQDPEVIWVSDAAGNLKRVASAGQQIDLGSGDVRTIAALHVAPKFFNDSNQVVFLARFTDNSRALLRTRLLDAGQSQLPAFNGGGADEWITSGAGTAKLVDLGGNAAVNFTAGSPVTITQPVSVPDGMLAFQLDARFLQPSGALQLFVADQLVGFIDSSAAQGPNLVPFAIPLNEGVVNTDYTTLKVVYDGPAGSQAIVDNILLGTIPPQWHKDGDGSWGENINWIGGVPDAPGAPAGFLSVITAARTITLDGDRTVGSMSFSNANQYRIVAGSGGVLTINNNGSPATIDVLAGAHRIDVAVSIIDNLTADIAEGSSLAIHGSLSVGAGKSLTKIGNGELAAGSIRGGLIDVQAGTLHILPNGSADGTSVVDGVSIAAGARFDLDDNDLIVVATPATRQAVLLSINDQIAHARNASAQTWQADGLTSSAAAADPATLTGLGVLLNDEGGQVIHAVFGGLPVDTNSILVKYTYNGDADLSGVVDADDYFQIDNSFASAGALTGWRNGDFDYSNTIDADDYFLIDSAFVGQTGALGAAMSQVPEPTLGITLLASLMSLTRLPRCRRSEK